MNKIELRINVGADDWAGERAVIASNEYRNFRSIISCSLVI